MPAAETRRRDATRDRHGRSARWLTRGLFVLSVVVLVLRLIEFSDRHLVVDDSYISFRYAANLAAGEGLVFNAGDRVEGYTNFLWTLLLSAGSAAGLDLVRFSQLLGALSALGCLVLLALISRRVLPQDLPARPLLVALPALLWAAMGSQAQLAGSGMESIFFVFWLLLAVHLLFLRDRPAAAGFVFALAAMTRPEGGLYGLVAGIVCLAWIVRPPGEDNRRRAWRRCWVLAASFLATYGPYFLWRYDYYGFLLPNTFYVKVGDMSEARLERGWDLLVGLVRDWGIAPLLVAALAALALRRGRRCGLPAWSFIVASVSYFVVVGGDFIPYFGPRFLLPSLPMLLLLVALGVGAMVRPVTSRKTAAAIASTLAAALVIWAGFFTFPASARELRWLEYEMEGWEHLGRWMASSVPPDASIAVGAAGIVPYYTGAPTIDMYGLVDKNIAHMPVRTTGFVRVAHEKFAPRYVMDRRPAYIITYLTPDGRSATGGLARVGRRLWTCYEWQFQVRVAEGATDDAPWLLPVDSFSPQLYEQGYRAALLRRRAEALAGC